MTQQPQFLLLHGWGQQGAAMVPLGQCLQPYSNFIAPDMPGFGTNPAPTEAWGSREYADYLIEQWPTLFPASADKEVPPLIVIGHSFGGRVALQLARHYPEKVSGVILVAGAGLQRKRSLLFRLRALFWKNLSRFAGKIDSLLKPMGCNFSCKSLLIKRIGSADYKAAGVLRPSFVKVIQEDLSTIAPDIKQPTLLLYGENDSETPPEFGLRYQALIPTATLYVFPRLDHYTVLGSGRHVVAEKIIQFIKTMA
ncbi:MAG: alpha/beta fold hydrolase [Alphaproteobacteria bacterium]